MAKMPAGVDNYEFTLTQDVRGYSSSVDPTILAPNWMVRGSQNVYKTPNGTIANRNGRKQYDVVNTTIAGTKTGKVWNTSFGANRILAIANSKLEVISDIITAGTFVHYTLLSGLTKTRGVFDAWWNNTLKKDELIFVLGDTSLYMWHGGIEKISTTTANTIVLTSDATLAGFPTSGNVLVNGTTYAFTGITSATLTGVTPNPTGEASGSAVISAIVTTATTPASGYNNDFIKVIGNALYVGSYTSRIIYQSSNTDYTNFTVPTPRIVGSPNIHTLDNIGRAITSRNGEVYFSAGTSDWYHITKQDITVGAVLQEQTNTEKLPVSLGAAAYSHEFVDVINDTIIYLSQDQQLRTVGTFRNLNQPAYPVLSQAVSTDLFYEDFTLGQLKVVAGGDKGDIIYIIAPNSGRVYLHQTKTSVNPLGNVISDRLWHAPFVWGISCIDSVGTTVIGFSNSNPQIYSLWDTGQWHDDSPSGQLSYTSVLLLSYRSYGRRQGKFRFDKIYWEGYMTYGTSLYGGVYYDYQGATSLLSPIIHSIKDNSPAKAASFFSGVVPPSLGDAVLGDNPLGDIMGIIGIGSLPMRDRDLLPKFRIITDVQLMDFYEWAPMIYTYRADDRFEIIAIGANITEAPFSAVELNK